MKKNLKPLIIILCVITISFLSFTSSVKAESLDHELWLEGNGKMGTGCDTYYASKPKWAGSVVGINLWTWKVEFLENDVSDRDFYALYLEQTINPSNHDPDIDGKYWIMNADTKIKLLNEGCIISNALPQRTDISTSYSTSFGLSVEYPFAASYSWSSTETVIYPDVLIDPSTSPDYHKWMFEMQTEHAADDQHTFFLTTIIITPENTPLSLEVEMNTGWRPIQDFGFNIGDDQNRQTSDFYILYNPYIPPSMPNIGGPNTATVLKPYVFTANSIDPEGLNLRYKFYFGDGTTHTSPWMGSGNTYSVPHTYTSIGMETLIVLVENTNGLANDDLKRITVINNPPNTPNAPTGPNTGYTDVYYTFTFMGSDPDGHQIRYQIDWGDGSTYTTGFMNSGTYYQKSHKWHVSIYGGFPYNVKVRVQDEYGTWSYWSSSKVILIKPSGDGPIII